MVFCSPGGIIHRKTAQPIPGDAMFISFFRTVILYVLIVATLRLMGKRQIGELEPAELVAAILISDLASVPMQDIGIPMLSGVIPILTLLAMELITAELSLRSIRFRKFFCGKPVFLIMDGVIDQKTMRKSQLSIDELHECLRENGILDISHVKYAILETNGKLTTFLYPEYSPLTAGMTQQKTAELELPVTVISDGRILSDNLRKLGFDRSWLDRQLTEARTAAEEVFLLTATRRGHVYLVNKEASL